MNGKAGLYIHIPFCASKCPYCDFYSVKYEKNAAQAYVKRLCKEFGKYCGAGFDTVYIGGGTPGILEPDMISEILAAAHCAFDIDEDSEITIECNPSKNLREDFKEYKKAGINRVSIGLQSAVRSERLALGRIAGRQEAAQAVADARAAGIFNISLDVMLGIPGQTRQSLSETLAFIGYMKVPHVSAYMLKIEEGTPFFRLQDKIDFPNADETADMYLQTVAALEQQGLLQYEISNFASSGFESRHNIKYWRLEHYLGIGKSAHSFWGGRRFYYDRDFNKVDDGAGGSDEEKIMLGLRLACGIEKSLVKKDFSAYVGAGFMQERGGRLAFTPKGFLVSNTIISELI